MMEAAALIKAKELSPVELTEAMFARISSLDDKLHSYLLVTEGLARQQAKAAEAEIHQVNSNGPMPGNPIGLKDPLYTTATPKT